jgi:hypothetical protein
VRGGIEAEAVANLEKEIVSVVATIHERRGDRIDIGGEIIEPGSLAALDESLRGRVNVGA